jgi:hypothetical protein
MDRPTTAAIVIAALGVAAASILAGSLPWISLLLALTFGFYGLVKKKAGLEPLLGLAAETLVAAPLALAYVIFRHSQGQGAFGQGPLPQTVLLAVSGVVTALPLLCFAAAANRISLTRMGFIQYLSPSLQLVLGLAVFAEALRPSMLVAFASVIIAVAIYALSREGANMEERAFVDRGRLPEDQGIREALGKAGPYYSSLEAMSDDCTKEWKYHNRRYGWTLKVSRRKKPIYWTTVLRKHFLVGCHLQEEERQAALAVNLSEGTRRTIEGAKKFPEGYGVELTVKDEASFLEAKAILGILLESRP